MYNVRSMKIGKISSPGIMTHDAFLIQYEYDYGYQRRLIFSPRELFFETLRKQQRITHKILKKTVLVYIALRKSR